ncbi:MAG: DUF929 family protein [Methanomassiliicoccales archaeon]
MRRRNIFIVISVCIAVALIAAAVSLHAPQKKTDTPLPQFAGRFVLVSQTPLVSGNKPVFLFIGSEACPYCAAESWAIVSALSTFGQWNNLAPIVSNATDSIPNVPGYTFANASLNARDLVFWEVELNSRSWSQTLQLPNSTEAQLFSKYDPQGKIPFILIGGMYAGLGTFINPVLEEGANWSSVNHSVSAGTGEFAQQVSSEIGNLTSAVKTVISHVSSAHVYSQHMLSGYYAVPCTQKGIYHPFMRIPLHFCPNRFAVIFWDPPFSHILYGRS